MLNNFIANVKARLWSKFLPQFVEKNDRTGAPYDYYAVYFSDVSRQRFQLTGFNGRDIDVESLSASAGDVPRKVQFPVSRLLEMDNEIVSHKKYGKISFSSIFSYAINHYLHFLDIKTFFLRGKGSLVSTFFRERELKSQERVLLLRLIVNEFVKRRPSSPAAGITLDEVIELLYGRLWYKHIRNEQFQYKIMLLIESLVLSGDLAVEHGRYIVQGNAIATLVEYEKEERRSQQQEKIQRNMVRLMLIITAATVLITLALLGLAGVIDLHKIWQDILQIKPVRVLFKLI
ncbi:hypothetical protein ACMYSK_10740 [Klebsiella sp. I138]|uniref:hypothetical protein n=1 Tax=Klebsiella sp. I138 TaxID=2755385 RepID=UPI003DAA47FC